LIAALVTIDPVLRSGSGNSPNRASARCTCCDILPALVIRLFGAIYDAAAVRRSGQKLSFQPDCCIPRPRYRYVSRTYLNGRLQSGYHFTQPADHRLWKESNFEEMYICHQKNQVTAEPDPPCSFGIPWQLEPVPFSCAHGRWM
jgi:hypothetical protein